MEPAELCWLFGCCHRSSDENGKTAYKHCPTEQILRGKKIDLLLFCLLESLIIPVKDVYGTLELDKKCAFVEPSALF